ncbi:uncharacterized protein LOC119557173 [Drosophila subpulchrella]|uniref:uncharacterized protein LOC119557173 n=1 Tax=Drosophila subpulchrella TaxID=1486046 RepID=UPI0018A14019|nr:uncharacterized protein LOC119557173 [Drosophila subpulchrella]
MTSCYGYRCPYEDGMDLSCVSLNYGRRIVRMNRYALLLTALKKMPPRPQKTARLFQPKLEKDKNNSTPSMIAAQKDRVKDIQLAAPEVKESESGHGRNHRGARIFDRHSGSKRTGVKAVDKRNGAGAHNWGSPEQEIQMHQKDDSRRNKQSQDVPIQSKAAVEKNSSKDSPVQLTLDEWRAMQAQMKRLLQKNQEKASEDDEAGSGKSGRSGDEAAGRRSGRQLRQVDIKLYFSSKPGPILKISDYPKSCPKVHDKGQFLKLS